MLTALANRLLAAIGELPAAPSLRLGAPLPGDTSPLVCVRATSLEPDVAGQDPSGGVTGPVTPRKIVRWSVDGQQRNFLLPERSAQLLEVRTPPGRRARRGDQFQLTPEGELAFYRAPTSEVVAELAEPARRGWQDQRPAVVELEVEAQSDDPAVAERLLMRSLGRALEVLGEEDVFAMADPEPGALRLRFLLDSFRVDALTARAAPAGEGALHSSVASLRLFGRMELAVAWAMPQPEGVIEEVRVRDLGARSPSAEADPSGAELEPSLAEAIELTEDQARPIEAAPLDQLSGVGDATAAKLTALTGADALGPFAAIDLDSLGDLSATGLSERRVRGYHGLAQATLNLVLPSSAPEPLASLTLKEAGALSLEALAEALGAPAQELFSALAAANGALTGGASEDLTLADFRRR